MTVRSNVRRSAAKNQSGPHRVRMVLDRLEERRLLTNPTFAHPGVLETSADFTRMSTKVATGAQPWAGGWNALVSDGYSQDNLAPRPLTTVIRGGTGQNYNQMVIDMQRTYQAAVRWKVSGDAHYADVAVAKLNAWSSTMTTLTGNSDRFLASGLYGFGWAAAADVMRSYAGWASADVTEFQNYLLNIYVPMEQDFLANHNTASITNYWANWDLANIEGLMAIGIFTDRHDLYDQALNYLYTGAGNGSMDKMVYFMHPGNLAQWQESGRDQGHSVLGMQLFGHIAQMAWNQGDDLFAYNNYQFAAAAEYIAKYNLGDDVPYESYEWGTGQSGTWSIQPGISGASRGDLDVGYELIYAHYHDVLGMTMQYSGRRIAARGIEWRGSGDDFGFGTLTYRQDPVTTGLAPKLTARERVIGQVELDWYGTSNATGYNVYRSTSANGTYTKIACNVTGLLAYTDFNLPVGTYYYKVRGITSLGETGDSNVVSATGSSQLQTQLAFDDGTGTTATDGTGNGHTGTLLNGAYFAAGKAGTAVTLAGDNDYVSLPAGVMAGMNDFTISAWVNLNDSRTWSRIFDFGDARGRWMYLTPRNGNGQVEFATSTVYGYNKQFVVGNAALPTNQWVHIAVTLQDRLCMLYVNGIAVGSNVTMDFAPFQFASTPNNWLGRSQYASDPYLNGTIDDFRISRGAMTAGQVYTLATGNAPPATPASPAVNITAYPGNQISLTWAGVAGTTAGYTVKRSTSAGGPYTILAKPGATSFTDYNLAAGVRYYYLVTSTNNGGDSANPVEVNAVALPPMPGTPAALTADANSSTTIALSWAGASDATSYTVKRALVSGGPYTTLASTITGTTYTDTGLTAGTAYYYVVSATNVAGTSANSAEASDTPSDLRARLPFNEGTGTLSADVSGNALNGTLINGPLWSTSGKLNDAVDLDGTDDYVSLPNGVVNNLTNFTIAAWVNPDVISTWSRIFDFGMGTNSYMFLSPRGGSNVLRFAITTSGGAGEQQINGNAAVPAGTWSHVAVTWANNVGTLYVNGIQVGQNAAMTLTPSSLGNTTLNYLGKSQFADPYFNGRIDDFRIYTRAMSAGEVNALATTPPPASPTGLTAAIVGSNQIDLGWTAVAGVTSGYVLLRRANSAGAYTIVADHLTGTTYSDTGLAIGLATGTTYTYIVVAANAGGESAYSTSASTTLLPPAPESPADLSTTTVNDRTVVLTWTPGTNAASYEIARALSANGPYSTIATGVTATSYTDTGLTDGTTYYYLVTALNAGGESIDPPGSSATPTDQRLQLKFDETSGSSAIDSSGNGFDGSLVDGPAFYPAGRTGHALDLDGTNDYVSLPAGAVAGLTDVTLSTWVNLDAITTYTRIFDFGTGTNSYMFLTPRGASNVVRFAITTSGNGAEQQINGTAALSADVWTHVAVTWSGGVGVLYVNGAEVGRNTAMTLNPASLGVTTQNYIGRSQFAADAYLNGRVDDFRVYSRALSPTEVSALATATVPVAPTGMNATAGDGQVALNWSTVTGASSYVIRRSTTSGGPSTIVAQDVAWTSYTDTGLTNGTTYYYTVAATSIAGIGAASSEVSATPIGANMAPSVSTAAAPTDAIVIGDTTTLSVVANDDGGAGNLNYTWSVVGTPPGSVTFANNGTNGASSTKATFGVPGVYQLSVTITDGQGLTATSSTTVTVALPGDATLDGAVNFSDLLSLAKNYGGTGLSWAQGDFTADRKVDFTDLLILAKRYGQSIPMAGGSSRQPIMAAKSTTTAARRSRSSALTEISVL